MKTDPIQDNSMPENQRLFVAVPVPIEVQTEIEKAQAQLRRALSEANIRWTTRQQFHLTLKFLGDVQAERTDALARALRDACHGFAPLRMRAERVGFFPHQRVPRVVWVGVDDEQGQLKRLQGAIEAACQPFTAEPPEKFFTGHVTLGRIKHLIRPEVEALAKAANVLAERFFGAWIAPELELMRSELSSHGARHTCRASIPLTEN